MCFRKSLIRLYMFFMLFLLFMLFMLVKFSCIHIYKKKKSKIASDNLKYHTAESHLFACICFLCFFYFSCFLCLQNFLVKENNKSLKLVVITSTIILLSLNSGFEKSVNTVWFIIKSDEKDIKLYVLDDFHLQRLSKLSELSQYTVKITTTLIKKNICWYGLSNYPKP